MSQITTYFNGSGPGTVASVTGGVGINITGNPSLNPVVNLDVPVTIAHGGTNAITMANTFGVNYFDGTSIVTTTVGTAGQVLTSNGAGMAPTFQPGGGGGGFSWAVITANQNAVSNHGYICNKAGTLVLTLPAASAVGDIIEVTGMNTALGWQIAQLAGQSIHFGIDTTTVGTGGSLSSTATNDSIRIVCNVANTTWIVLSSIGNITFV